MYDSINNVKTAGPSNDIKLQVINYNLLIINWLYNQVKSYKLFYL